MGPLTVDIYFIKVNIHPPPELSWFLVNVSIIMGHIIMGWLSQLPTSKGAALLAPGFLTGIAIKTFLVYGMRSNL